MDSNELMKLRNRINDDFISKKTKLEDLMRRKEDLEKSIEASNISDIEASIVLLNKLAVGQRQAARKMLEDLGTKALQYSMGQKYSMRIVPEGTRARPQEYVYIYNSETGVDTDPLEEDAGGIVDIVSSALRITLASVNSPFLDGPLIFDEPFKMLSEGYIPMISEFLKKIQKEFGRQIIIITHNIPLAEACDSTILIGGTIDDIINEGE